MFENEELHTYTAVIWLTWKDLYMKNGLPRPTVKKGIFTEKSLKLAIVIFDKQLTENAASTSLNRIRSLQDSGLLSKPWKFPWHLDYKGKQQGQEDE